MGHRGERRHGEGGGGGVKGAEGRRLVGGVEKVRSRL